MAIAMVKLQVLFLEHEADFLFCLIIAIFHWLVITNRYRYFCCVHSTSIKNHKGRLLTRYLSIRATRDTNSNLQMEY